MPTPNTYSGSFTITFNVSDSDGDTGSGSGSGTVAGLQVDSAGNISGSVVETGSLTTVLDGVSQVSSLNGSGTLSGTLASLFTIELPQLGLVIPSTLTSLTFSQENGATVINFTDTISVSNLDIGGGVTGSGYGTLQGKLVEVVPPSLTGLAQVALASYPTQSGFNPFATQTLSDAPPQSISVTDANGNPLVLSRIDYQTISNQQVVAYATADGSQIFVGVQGTDNIPNLVTDISTWAGAATGGTASASQSLISNLTAAANFIQQVQQDHPGAAITLTGHSLGGAEAQILGYYLNLPAVGFNAPGSGELVGSASLNTAFASIDKSLGFTPGSGTKGNENVSIQTDVVHIIGAPLGTQLTIVPKGAQEPPTWYTTFEDHLNTTIISELNGVSTGQFAIVSTPQHSSDPLVSVPLHIPVSTPSSGGSKTITSVTSAGDALLVDPPAGTDIVYVASPTSAALASLMLPADGDAIAAFRVSLDENGVWAKPSDFAPGTVVQLDGTTQGFRVQALDAGGNPLTLPEGYSFFLTAGVGGSVSGNVSSFAAPAPNPQVESWFSSLLRESPSSGPDSGLAAQFDAAADAGADPASVILPQIVTQARSTSSVAVLAYEFFTGSAPSAAGMDYLVSPTGPNPDNLNSAYYQGFNTTNRYINFASNLGRAGAGAAQFATDYGSLTPEQAMTKAYQTIFGGTPSADKVNHLLYDLVPDGNGGTETRLAYFETYGQDGPSGVGTKAAMVGWLMAEAVAADLGTYAKSNDAFLTDVALHNAAFGIDIIGQYAQPSFDYQPT